MVIELLRLELKPPEVVDADLQAVEGRAGRLILFDKVVAHARAPGAREDRSEIYHAAADLRKVALGRRVHILDVQERVAPRPALEVFDGPAAAFDDPV